MAARAPIPATSAKLLGACLIPTTELTLSGKVTSNGVRKTRLVLMNANVYTDVKPHPTLCAAGDSGGIDLLAWRIVAAMFDRERLVTGTRG